MGDREIELDNVVTRVPRGWWNNFGLKKKRVTELLSVRIITGFEVPLKICPNSLSQSISLKVLWSIWTFSIGRD